ncbi:MAG: hypothetical protein CSYNP_01135 [Syntrophus sp. SKADARSKE-3]|nr:hypothetical protein [Syntrophus sp. SKADARSKE-3]
MNREVIHHLENGLLAMPIKDWGDTLLHLIENHKIRKQFDKEARKTVEYEYFYEVTTPQLASVLRTVAFRN